MSPKKKSGKPSPSRGAPARKKKPPSPARGARRSYLAVVLSLLLFGGLAAVFFLVPIEGRTMYKRLSQSFGGKKLEAPAPAKERTAQRPHADIENRDKQALQNIIDQNSR